MECSLGGTFGAPLFGARVARRLATDLSSKYRGVKWATSRGCAPRDVERWNADAQTRRDRVRKKSHRLSPISRVKSSRRLRTGVARRRVAEVTPLSGSAAYPRRLPRRRSVTHASGNHQSLLFVPTARGKMSARCRWGLPCRQWTARSWYIRTTLSRPR